MKIELEILWLTLRTMFIFASTFLLTVVLIVIATDSTELNFFNGIIAWIVSSLYAYNYIKWGVDHISVEENKTK